MDKIEFLSKLEQSLSVLEEEELRDITVNMSNILI